MIYTQGDNIQLPYRPIFRNRSRLVWGKKNDKKNDCNDFLFCLDEGMNFTSEADWQHQNPSPAVRSHPISSFGTEIIHGGIY